MRAFLLIAVTAAALTAAGLVDATMAVERCACRHGQYESWHGDYYHVAWGMPVALVVPPNAENQVHWGWGVGNTRVTPICSQFGRSWPGPVSYDRGMFRPTPRWPSDTDQFGVYYLRGPW
ncbi:MAG: hypothetical protein JXB62_13510 [Pirellulales bacterium]|nr:hypothetical protein [Pirellulales bacterium]